MSHFAIRLAGTMIFRRDISAPLRLLPNRLLYIPFPAPPPTLSLHRTHRGACGCEANTGDGAGILLAMPDQFLTTMLLEDKGERTSIPCIRGTGQEPTCLLIGEKPHSPGISGDRLRLRAPMSLRPDVRQPVARDHGKAPALAQLLNAVRPAGQQGE